jgi:hypothetical protein
LQLAAIDWNKRSPSEGRIPAGGEATCRRHNKIQLRSSKMGVVMIKCPQTGRAIPTGMEADRERFRCSPVFFARTFCSMCKTSHEWFAREAWVHEPDEKRHGAGAALALQPA